MKKTILILLLHSISLVFSAQNLYVGDTSVEAHPDTLTRGNYSTGLVPWSWDDTTAYHGQRSIRIDWDKVPRHRTTNPALQYLDSFLGIVNSPELESNEVYTFSFYAKASTDDCRLSLRISPTHWSACVKGSVQYRKLSLSKEWQRYTFTFKVIRNEQTNFKGYSVTLDLRQSPVGQIWYDAIQLEKGDKATAYHGTSGNVGIMLKSDNIYHIYYDDEPVKAELRAVISEPSEFKYRIIDYQGKTILEETKTISGNYHESINLNLNRLGWFKTIVELRQNNKLVSSHYANFLRVAKPVKRAEGIEPFSGMISGNFWDYIYLPMQKLGVKKFQVLAHWRLDRQSGSEVKPGKFDWSNLEWQLKMARQYGLYTKVTLSPFRVPDWYFDEDALKSADKYGHSPLVMDASKHQYWRNYVREVMVRYGNMIDEVDLGSEDNGRLGINEYYKNLYPDSVEQDAKGQSWVVKGKAFDDLYAMVEIAAEEIRKQYPDMKIGAIRPSQGRVGDEWLYVIRAFQKAGKFFNVFPVDTYLAVPYNYGPEINNYSRRGNLDGRFHTYKFAKELTRKYGNDQPVFIAEAGTAIDPRYPDESIYRQEQAEIIAKDFITSRTAGFYSYCWYMGLGGLGATANYNFYLSQNNYIQSGAAAYSAVAQIVENVTATQWLAPDHQTRIAILKKQDGRGTAAIWATKGYTVKIPLAELKVTDMMGNPVQDVNNVLSLSTAPLYLHHPDYTVLCDIMKKAEIEQTEFCQIRFRQVSSNTGRLLFQNISNTKDITVIADVTSNGKTIRHNLDIPRNSRTTCDIHDYGQSVQVSARLENGAAVMVKSFEPAELIPIENTPVTIGQIANRVDIHPGDPWVPWSGPADLSARIFANWDADYLYLKAEVTDDKHYNNSPKAPWSADSLQIGIDPKNNGPFILKTLGRLLEADDIEFTLALDDQKQKHLVVSHGRKIFTDNDYQITRDDNKHLTSYTVRISWQKLGIKPAAEMVFGMSMALFDDDTGNGQDYHAQFGEGITYQKNAAVYKKFILK